MPLVFGYDMRTRRAYVAQAELRDALGLLRDSDGSAGQLLPRPGEAAASGRCGALRLPIAQESLAIVLKHFGATPAQVCFIYSGSELVVEVRDDGSATASAAPELEWWPGLDRDARTDPHAGRRARSVIGWQRATG